MRRPIIQTMHRYPFLKNKFAKLPFDYLRNLGDSEANRYGFVLVLNEQGDIVDSYHDATGRLYAISSAQPHDGYVYFGTLFGQAIGRIQIAE